MNVQNQNFMKLAAMGTWLGDFITAGMVTDMMLQDWEFPHFAGALDVKLPGLNTDSIDFQLPGCFGGRPVDVYITGKWFNYGIIFLVMMLDLNMWKNQIFYDPLTYGQYTDTNDYIYTVSDKQFLSQADRQKEKTDVLDAAFFLDDADDEPKEDVNQDVEEAQPNKNKKGFKYYLRHPYFRLFTAYFVVFCNFLIFAEDPVSHSCSDCIVDVIGNIYSFIMARYPPNAGFCVLKVFMFIVSVITGMIVGKFFFHRFLFCRVLKLKIFSEEGQRSDAIIDSHSSELFELNHKIWENPELAYEEHFAHNVLAEFLSCKGFDVARHHKLKTGFRAESGSGNGPTVAVLCEYDALPGVGHGCGHNLIAESGIAAGLGIKEALEGSSFQGKVVVMGTPAEEGGGGKIDMINAGCFKDVDVCMMLHPAPFEVPFYKCQTMSEVIVTYHGKSAHAVGQAHKAINALDAAVLAYNNISVLRQQIKPTWSVHGIFTDAGKKPNVIPDRSELQFYVRTTTNTDAAVLKAKVQACFEGGALATGCTADIKWLPNSYAAIETNVVLAQLYQKHAEVLGVEFPLTREEQESIIDGSTDMGNVTLEGSWMVMFMTVLLFAYIWGFCYNVLLLLGGPQYIPYKVSKNMGIKNETFMKVAAMGTWFGDFITAWMVTDMMLQDWEFPSFAESTNIKLPGIDTGEVTFRIPGGEVNITGKWFNYGIIFIVMILDLNMWKNQIFYEPFMYGQYTDSNNYIYTVCNRTWLKNATREMLTYEWRFNNTDWANITYGPHDQRTNSKYIGFPLSLKGIAFGPSIAAFVLFGFLAKKFARDDDKEKNKQTKAFVVVKEEDEDDWYVEDEAAEREMNSKSHRQSEDNRIAEQKDVNKTTVMEMKSLRKDSRSYGETIKAGTRARRTEKGMIASDDEDDDDDDIKLSMGQIIRSKTNTRTFAQRKAYKHESVGDSLNSLNDSDDERKIPPKHNNMSVLSFESDDQGSKASLSNGRSLAAKNAETEAAAIDSGDENADPKELSFSKLQTREQNQENSRGNNRGKENWEKLRDKSSLSFGDLFREADAEGSHGSLQSDDDDKDPHSSSQQKPGIPRTNLLQVPDSRSKSKR
ncbi:hypothetical protein QZH41_003212 [Actinostola sp. cb2023]|nr:hypothetical protein QZH41_003212 [Actinostola sp. cb2023]